MHTYKNVLYAHTCRRTHLRTCTLIWGMVWFSVNVIGQQLDYSHFFLLFQTGLARCADRLPFLKELEECHNIYIHGCSDHLYHPLLRCQRQRPCCVKRSIPMLFSILSGLKQSTKKLAFQCFHDTFLIRRKRTPKKAFVQLKSVLFISCVFWIFFQNAGSQLCFRVS